MGWFLYGLILGAGGMRLFDWVHEAPVSVGWYVWVLGAVAVLLGTLAVQHFYASRKELEYRAAWVGLLSLGIPAITCVLFAWLSL